MYFQQQTTVFLEYINHFSDVYNVKWKQIIIPKSLQHYLNVKIGDAVIIRKNLLSSPLVCVVCGTSPEEDDGNLVRVFREATKRIGIEAGEQVLIEKIDVISAETVAIEWYYHQIPKQFMYENLRKNINKQLHESIFLKFADLPLMERDRFSMTLSINSETNQTSNISLWIRAIKPQFPVVKLKPDTIMNIY